jgi:pimeloyl-ACP methyl ester carboxylesterase
MQVELDQGTIRYTDRGEGPTMVFVHGLLVNGSLWRKVVPSLEPSFRCIVPDWPIGSHPAAMRPDADLSPSGLATIIADFLAALDLDEVTLVANDTGGAITQIVVTEHPERVGRLVLTPCDAFENFLPPMFRVLQWSARVPIVLTASLQLLRIPAFRRLPMAFGWLAKHPIDRAVTTGWLRPYLSNRGVRRDTAKVLRGISPRYTLAAAAKLGAFDRPTLIVGAPEDKFFPLEHAERLATILPDARIELVDDSYTFVSEDQPERLAELISAFMTATA